MMNYMSNSLSLHVRAHREATAPERLPPPDAVAQAHSERLIERLQREIAEQGGSISFARYMERVLYAPGLGYYVAGTRKFGADGDFVTAPEISPLFSRCLARQVGQILERLGGGAVLEAGAGSGVMAADLLAELASMEMLPDRYLILEVSAELQERQRAFLHRKVPHLLERVEWLERLPEAPLNGIVVANELLDALPVHRFQVERSGVKELRVGWSGEGFCWVTEAAGSQRLAKRLKEIAGGLPEGYRSEVGLAAGDWVSSMARLLGRGALLLIDYGFPRHEYYHPQRNEGTLMCHYRHRAHTDPFVLPGLQDVTAHVDFTSVAEAAVEAGLMLYGYTTQAYFLLANGLEQMLQEVMDTDDPVVRLEWSRQAKMLTMPQEMGELFKVMIAGKGLEGSPLSGFSLYDLRGKL